MLTNDTILLTSIEFALKTNSNISIESKVFFSNKIPGQRGLSPIQVKDIVHLVRLYPTAVNVMKWRTF